MFVVTIEVWPGGDPLRKRNIGSLVAANVTDLAEDSTYEFRVDGGELLTVEHKRSDGAWALVRRCMDEAGV